MVWKRLEVKGAHSKSKLLEDRRKGAFVCFSEDMDFPSLICSGRWMVHGGKHAEMAGRKTHWHAPRHLRPGNHLD